MGKDGRARGERVRGSEPDAAANGSKRHLGSRPIEAHHAGWYGWKNARRSRDLPRSGVSPMEGLPW